MFFISDALRDQLLQALAMMMNGLDTVVQIYDGIVPLDSSASIGSSNKLVEITVDALAAGYVSFDMTPVGGTIVKTASEDWHGAVLANGTATYYRVCDVADTNAASTTALRLQGSVGTVNADLLVNDVNLILGDDQRIDYFTIGLPESA